VLHPDCLEGVQVGFDGLAQCLSASWGRDVFTNKDAFEPPTHKWYKAPGTLLVIKHESRAPMWASLAEM
jgi:hypothetical protein